MYEASGSSASLGFGTIALREIVGKFVSGFVLCLGYLWILWDRDFQGWYDKIAGTVVIRSRNKKECITYWERLSLLQT